MPNKEIIHDYGKINAWELYKIGGPESPEVSLLGSSDADYFLYLLFSDSSERIEFVETHTPPRPGWGATLRLWGPVADDAVYPESGIPRWHTEYLLRRYDLHYYLQTKDERDEFVGRLHELGGGGEGFRETCKALRVRMLGRS